MRVASMLLLGLAATVLSACGGAKPKTFDQLNAEGQALFTAYRSAAPTGAGMPSAGSATYNGVAAFNIDPDVDTIINDPQLVGALRLEANFGTNSVTGKVDNFVDQTNAAAPGSVSITDGVISSDTFIADLGGSIKIGDDQATVAGDMDGQFRGANADTVGGNMTTTLTGTGGSTILHGYYAAAK